MRSEGLHRRQRCRGFTLTELAVVFGLVGVVVAGVWTAAAAVQAKAKIHQANEQLALIVTSLQTLYASQNVSYSALNTARTLNAAPTSADFTYYMTNYYTTPTSNVFPSEMVSGGAVSNPWSGTVKAALVSGSSTNPSQYPVEFVVEYQGIPADACTALVTNNSTADRTTGLQKIVITDALGDPPSSYSGTNLPVSVSTLAGVCTATNGPYIIDWYYKLGQGCPPGSPC